MAPEQLRGDRVDDRADLYAFGATLYEMLAGKRYLDFESMLPMDASLAVVEDRPDLPVPGVPTKINEMLGELLAKDPDERPASARELRERLHRVEARIVGTERSG
jgi:serine/threonine-protein kinase